jgi:hypothetical protein
MIVTACYNCHVKIEGDGWLFADGATEVCMDCHRNGATGICSVHTEPLADCLADGFEDCKSILAPVFCGAGELGCEVDHA